MDEIDAYLDECRRRYPRLRKLAIALAIFIPTVGIPTYDFYFGDKSVSLSKDDRELLNQLLERTKENPEVKVRKQNFFRTLERDKSITSAGVAEGKKDDPIISVPAVQFALSNSPRQSGVAVDRAFVEARHSGEARALARHVCFHRWTSPAARISGRQRPEAAVERSPPDPPTALLQL
jgi:hypothetical protein